MSKGYNFITVSIDGKCYDYPKCMPIPRVGELIRIDESKTGMVRQVRYDVSNSTAKQERNLYRIICIETDLY